MTGKHRNSARTATEAIVGRIRRHPGRALAICGPLVAASVLTGTTVASAHPTPTLAVSRAELNAPPAPLVDNADSGLSGTRVIANKQDRPVPEPVNISGCDYDYGTPNMCVPWKIPASSPQAACAWLKANGFGPLKVYGTNRQHLPENAEGYVCAGAS